MNTFAKVLAPVLLSVAAVGANASELAWGDVGSQPVRAGSATAAVVTAPVGAVGQIAAGDLNTVTIAAPRERTAAPAMATPRIRIESQFAVGA